MKNALVLCSGGIDSVTTAFYVKRKLDYNKLRIIFFNYGQRNLRAERTCSRATSKAIGAWFVEIKIKYLNEISTSLLNSNEKHKSMKRKDLKNTSKESAKWYVPCRNTLFLAHALALSESLHIKNKEKNDIFVGFKCEGEESFPDTTKKFILKINELCKACNNPVKVIAPFINKDKDDVIKLGNRLGVDFKKTFSCYTSNEKHCGTCLSCRLRQEGFYWANVKDPTGYAKNQ